MRRARSGLVRLAVGVATVAMAACTPLDDGGPRRGAVPTTTAVATRASFLRRANALCEDLGYKARSLNRSMLEPGGGQAYVAAVMKEYAVSFADTLAQLRALAQPPADVAELQALYARIDAVIPIIRALAVAAQQGDGPGFWRLEQELQGPLDEADAAFAAYGMTACAAG